LLYLCQIKSNNRAAFYQVFIIGFLHGNNKKMRYRNGIQRQKNGNRNCRNPQNNI